MTVKYQNNVLNKMFKLFIHETYLFASHIMIYLIFQLFSAELVVNFFHFYA